VEAVTSHCVATAVVHPARHNPMEELSTTNQAASLVTLHHAAMSRYCFQLYTLFVYACVCVCVCVGGGGRERESESKLKLHWNLCCFKCSLNFIDKQFVITTHTVNTTL